ncbi:MAG: hypothetical protein M1821_003939 [Bathelium mastoideum]|nr:MAG: hypothetical protein M1821_003939 [Bathelium mastoideum]
MDAGASAITFIVLALSSAKAVHSVLSAVKDAPANVRTLMDLISQLEGLLEQLSTIQANQATRSCDAALASTTEKCHTDIASLANKLLQMHISPADRRIGRLWKRLKATISEKDLERMRSLIRDHVAMLNSSQILERLGQLQDQVASLRGPAAADSHETLPFSHSDTATTTGQAGRTNAACDALACSISRLIELVHKKDCEVDSDDDATQLISDLQALLDNDHQKWSPTALIDTVKETGARLDVSKELSLTKNLIGAAPSIAINKDGKKNIPRLRMRTNTNAIQTVEIQFAASIPSGTFVDQQRKRKCIDIGNGVLSLVTNKRQRRNMQLQHQIGTQGKDNKIREFIANVMFISKDLRSIITLTINQRQTLYDSVSSIPRLYVSNILPSNSLVFELAANGQVEDLKTLIADGKASLHDHDPRGWSLLHVSIGARDYGGKSLNIM